MWTSNTSVSLWLPLPPFLWVDAQRCFHISSEFHYISLRGKGHCKSNTKMFWLTAFILGNNASLTGLMRMKMMWIICYGLHSHQIMSDRALHHHHHHQTLNEGTSFRRMVFIPPVDFHRFEELIPRNTHVAVVLNRVSCVSVRRFFKSTHIKSLKELQ